MLEGTPHLSTVLACVICCLRSSFAWAAWVNAVKRLAVFIRSALIFRLDQRITCLLLPHTIIDEDTEPTVEEMIGCREQADLAIKLWDRSNFVSALFLG